MIGSSLFARRSPLLWAAGVTTAVTLAASGVAVATDTGHPVPPPPAVPSSAGQIQNIDQVKTAIKGYYGDTLTSTPDPYKGTVDLHATSPNSPYAKEMAGIVGHAERYLASAGHRADRDHHRPPHHARKAILLDVDDTTLNTYNYEIYSNFVYDPTSNAAFVNAGAFPAVFHMPDLVRYAKSRGYSVLYLTGRPGTQRAGTVANLEKTGYGTVAADHLFLKDYAADTWLAPCATTCTTIEYKSLTRKYIEHSLGYDIVANFGDQYSDLTGGYADKDFKLPNPMYYLP